LEGEIPPNSIVLFPVVFENEASTLLPESNQSINWNQKLGTIFFDGLSPFSIFQLTSDSLSLMTNSIEAEMVKMHLAHLAYDGIKVQLGIGRSRISPTIRAFH
jgi:hypothetical protein